MTTPRMTPVDWSFLALRILTWLGGILWWVVVPTPPAARQWLGILLVVYLLYSALLYTGIFMGRADRSRWYLSALPADAALVYLLVTLVGMGRGSFFIAFYLVTALHAFYFGIRIGLAAAGLSGLLYLVAWWQLGGQALLPWWELALRQAFLLLIGSSLGLVSERRMGDAERIRRLNADLQARNELLEQSYRYLSIGRVAGGIAQSMNNPAGIIAGRAAILLQESRDGDLPERFRHDLEVIAHHAYRIGITAKTLLAFARPEERAFRPVKLNDVAEDALLLMAMPLERGGVTVARNLAPDLPVIPGDHGRLKEALVHLISNALEAMGGGGRLTVTTGREANGHGVFLRVGDTGPGLPGGQEGRIFEPFFSTKGPGRGTGLGLSTCLKIVSNHGGRIAAENAPGGGAVFTLTFPPVTA
jgi:signal transduction histidine kinase